MARKKEQTILLVPVDFTSFSEDALVFASGLAKCMSAQLLVLHVIHDPAESPGFYARNVKKKKYLQNMEEAADEMMQEFLDKMRQAFPGNEPIKKATPLLVTGTPVTRIVDVAENKQATMIILGSQGRTGLSGILLGSKAAQVVQLSTIPVTVVKTSKKK